MDVANSSYNRMEPNSARLYLYVNPPLNQAPSEIRVPVAQLSPLSFFLQSSGESAIK
jgi:hypothetical protein